MKDHRYYLNLCLDLAEASAQNGNHPFGALLVYDDKIICQSENKVETNKDITAHAELLLVQKAQKVLNPNELKESTLYTSTEPCPMCFGAIYWAEIPRIVFGCSNKQLNTIAGKTIEVSNKQLNTYSDRKITIIDCSNEEKYQKVHIGFWN